MRPTPLARKSSLKKPKELTKNEIWDALQKKITQNYLDRVELNANQKNTLLHPLKELFLNTLGLEINIVEGSADLNNLNKFVISTETYNSDDSLYVKYNFLGAAFIKRSLEIRALFEKIDAKTLNSPNIQDLITYFGLQLSDEISKKTFKFPKEKQFYFFKYRKIFLECALPNEGLLFDRDFLNQAIKPSLDYFARANGEFKFYEKWHQFSQVHNDLFKNGLTFQTNLFLPLKEIYINTVSLLFTEVENSLDDIDNLLISKETSSNPQKKADFIKGFLTRKAQNISAQIEQFDLSQYDTQEGHKKLNDLFVLYKEFFTTSLKEKLSTILPENIKLYSSYREFFLSQIAVNQQEIKPKFDELKMDLLQMFRESYSQTSLLKADRVSPQNSSDSLLPHADQSLLPPDNIMKTGVEEVGDLGSLSRAPDNIIRTGVEEVGDLGSLSVQVLDLKLPRSIDEPTNKRNAPRVLTLTPRNTSKNQNLAASDDDGIADLTLEKSTQTPKQNEDEILLQQQRQIAENHATLLSLGDEIQKIKTELSEIQNQPEQTSQESTELLRASQWLDIETNQSDDRLLEQVEHRNWLPTEDFDNEAHRQKPIEKLPEDKQNLIQENAKLLSLKISKVKFSSVTELLQYAYQGQIIGPDNKVPTLSQVEELMNSLQKKDAELAKLRGDILELQTRLSENKDPQDELQNFKQIIEDLNKQNRSLHELLDKQLVAESSEMALSRGAADRGKLEIELKHSKELESNAKMIERQLQDNKELDQKLQKERQVSQEKIQELEQQLSDMSQQNSALLTRLESLMAQHKRFISDTELKSDKIFIENQQLQQENARLQQQFETKHQFNQDLQQENERLKKQLQDVSQVSQSKDVRINELEQQNETLQERLTESQSREHLLFQKNLELSQQIENIKTEHQESDRLHQEEKNLLVTNLNKRLKDVRQECQDLQQENERLQQQSEFENKTYFAKIQELEQQWQQQREVIQNLQQQLQEALQNYQNSQQQMQEEPQEYQNLQQENERLQRQMQEERKAAEEKMQELKQEVIQFQALLNESDEDLTILQQDFLSQSALLNKKTQESLENSNHSSQMGEIIISLSKGMELLNKALVSALEQINKPSFQPNQRLRGDSANGNSNFSSDDITRAIQISSSPGEIRLTQELNQNLGDGNANGNSGFSKSAEMSSMFRPSSSMEVPSTLISHEGSRRSNDCDVSISGVARSMEAPSTLVSHEGSQQNSNDCDVSISGVDLFKVGNGQGTELSPRSIVSNSSHVGNAESLDGETASRGFIGTGLARRVSDIVRWVSNS